MRGHISISCWDSPYHFCGLWSIIVAYHCVPLSFVFVYTMRQFSFMTSLNIHQANVQSTYSQIIHLLPKSKQVNLKYPRCMSTDSRYHEINFIVVGLSITAETCFQRFKQDIRMGCTAVDSNYEWLSNTNTSTQRVPDGHQLQFDRNLRRRTYNYDHNPHDHALKDQTEQQTAR